MWLREQVLGGLTTVVFMATVLLVADSFTKLFGAQRQENFIAQLGMVDLKEVVTVLARK